METELPEFIYKYVRLNDHFYDLITNKQLWFSLPKKFNDPFDCKLYLFPGMNSTGWEYVFNLPKEYSEKLDFKLLMPFFDKMIEKENSTKSFQEKLDAYGICSFSKNPNNLLLWAHYTDCHKGACLKFRTSILKKNFNLIKTVNYYDKFPHFDPSKDVENALILAPLCKSKHWEYEEEVRIITEKEGLFQFPVEAIEQVTFGIKSNYSNKLIKEMKDLGYKNTKFMSATLARGSYEVIYNEIPDFFINCSAPSITIK